MRSELLQFFDPKTMFKVAVLCKEFYFDLVDLNQDKEEFMMSQEEKDFEALFKPAR
jgi:hypothetical protein